MPPGRENHFERNPTMRDKLMDEKRFKRGKLSPKKKGGTPVRSDENRGPEKKVECKKKSIKI